MLLFSACGDLAKTLNPDDVVTPPPTSDISGYYYPRVISHYAAAKKIVILFNMSVLASDLDDEIDVYYNLAPQLLNTGYTLSTASPWRSVTIDLTTAAAGDNVTVVVGTGIHDAANTVMMTVAYPTISYTIPSAATVDTTAPGIILGSRTPGSGITTASREVGSVSVQLSEYIDFGTVNSTTFYLHDDTNDPVGTNIPATYYFNATTRILYLYPTVKLDQSSTHTVTLTTGITDLSGNAIASNITWVFYTPANTPAAFNLDGPELVSIGTDTFTISWSTDKISKYEIFAGRNGSPASYYVQAPAVYPDDYVSSVTYTTGVLADEGARYWYRVLCTDEEGNTVTHAVRELNLFTTEIPVTLHATGGNEGGLNTISYANPSYSASGIAAFWTSNSGNAEIYGKLFDNNGDSLLNWVAPVAILTGANYTYRYAFNDGVGGIIVLATTGTNLVAKRLDSSAATVWGGAGGFTISTTATEAGGAVVYSGLFNSIAQGDIESDGISLGNVFYEDQTLPNALGSYVSTGNIIYNDTNNVFSTLTKSDHNYILGTADDISYNSGDSMVAASATETGSSTVQDHTDFDTISPVDYETNGTTIFYTTHNYSGLNASNIGNLVKIGALYARITNVQSRGYTSLAGVGNSENLDYRNHIVTTTNMPTTFVCTQAEMVNDLVFDGTSYALVNSMYNDYDVELKPSTATIITEGESCSFRDQIADGTVNTWSWLAPKIIWDQNAQLGSAAVGDFIIRLDASNNVVGVTTIAAITDWGGNTYEIECTNNIGLTDSSPNDHYMVFEQASRGTVVALTNLLTNSTASVFSTVTDGDLVKRTSPTTAYAKVVSHTDNIIVLDTDNFSGPANSGYNYEIYHHYCDTHDTADPILEVTLDHAITIADSDTFYYYVPLITWTAAWNQGLYPANPLFDNNPATIFTLPTLYDDTDGDIVFNYTDGTYTYIGTGYTVHGYAMGLGANIFSDADEYRIYRFYWDNTYANCTDITKAGISGAFSSGHLLGAGFGPVTSPVGAVAFNAIDRTCSLITDIVSANNLLLSWNNFTAANIPYLISDRSGVLIAWQNGANVNAKVISLNLVGAESDPVDLTTTTSFAGTTPRVIPDGYGNAYLIYRNAAGQLQARFYDGALHQLWAGDQPVDTDSASAEAIIDAKSDGNGGVVVLYTYGTQLRMQRITTDSHTVLYPTTTTMSRLWTEYTGTCRQVAAGASSGQRMVLDIARNAAVVTWVDTASGEVYVRRIAATNSTARRVSPVDSLVQRNPSVYIDAAGAKIMVVWEDNRFFGGITGWGTFGSKWVVSGNEIDPDANWYADSTDTDYNGVAFVLHNFNYTSQSPLLMPYNNNADVYMFWEDFEVVANKADLLYMDPLSTSYLPAW